MNDQYLDLARKHKLMFDLWIMIDLLNIEF